ncbi:hypothetical protein PAPYR_9574 [Paratrimastix pyriformis]|uniref:Uncharacterized protein n=1 Tax=Paratrimastix pyriformis TaxID=342808 RepID=A0ABQ8UCV5_9EUKA|nr:hypothetical protein PAPYR_9574 [Paratrimastix pyriformis]
MKSAHKAVGEFAPVTPRESPCRKLGRALLHDLKILIIGNIWAVWFALCAIGIWYAMASLPWVNDGLLAQPIPPSAFFNNATLTSVHAFNTGFITSVPLVIITFLYNIGPIKWLWMGLFAVCWVVPYVLYYVLWAIGFHWWYYRLSILSYPWALLMTAINCFTMRRALHKPWSFVFALILEFGSIVLVFFVITFFVIDFFASLSDDWQRYLFRVFLWPLIAEVALFCTRISAHLYPGSHPHGIYLSFRPPASTTSWDQDDSDWDSSTFIGVEKNGGDHTIFPTITGPPPPASPSPPPPDHQHNLPNIIYGAQLATQICGRFLLVAFKSQQMAVAATATGAIIEVILRITGKWRDRFFTRLFTCFQVDTTARLWTKPYSADLKHASHMTETIAENGSVLSCPMLQVFFYPLRSFFQPNDHAPNPVTLLASAVAQWGIEAGTDLATVAIGEFLEFWGCKRHPKGVRGKFDTTPPDPIELKRLDSIKSQGIASAKSQQSLAPPPTDGSKTPKTARTTIVHQPSGQALVSEPPSSPMTPPAPGIRQPEDDAVLMAGFAVNEAEAPVMTLPGQANIGAIITSPPCVEEAFGPTPAEVEEMAKMGGLAPSPSSCIESDVGATAAAGRASEQPAQTPTPVPALPLCLQNEVVAFEPMDGDLATPEALQQHRRKPTLTVLRELVSKFALFFFPKLYILLLCALYFPMLYSTWPTMSICDNPDLLCSCQFRMRDEYCSAPPPLAYSSAQ